MNSRTRSQTITRAFEASAANSRASQRVSRRAAPTAGLLAPRIAPNGSFADAEDYRRTFPDGRIGSDPSQATPEHGKRFYDTAVDEVAADYEKWVVR